jgi:hypothetical protein
MKKRLCVCVCLLLIFASLQGQNSEKKIRTVRGTNTSGQKRDITVVAQNENFVSSGQQEEFYYIEKDFSLAHRSVSFNFA